MLNNPVEDFMSEKSNNESKYKDEDDEVVIDKISKSKPTEKICRI